MSKNSIDHGWPLSIFILADLLKGKGHVKLKQWRLRSIKEHVKQILSGKSQFTLVPFYGSGSWFRKLDADVQTVRFQGSVFVGTCHLLRRVLDKIEHVLFPSVFFLITDLCQKVIFTVFTGFNFWNQQKSDP